MSSNGRSGRSGDSDDRPLYKVGDRVWMISHRRRRGQAAKLQPKFVGPYCVIEVMSNHTYTVERSGQVSIQNEARVKPYWASLDAAGQAPPLLEPTRRPPMRGRGLPYKDIEEVLPDQEGADDTPTDPPGHLHPRRRRLTHRKTSLNRPHHQWSRPTGLSSQMRWYFLKFMRKRQLGRHHPCWWTPPLPRSDDTTHGGRHRIVKGILTKNIINFSQNVVQVLA